MALRRDAVRNRAVLLRAAAEVFRAEGADAPLDHVAKRAHLGRGTLYRHFPDRGALLAALLEGRVATLAAFAESYEGDDLVEQLLVEICSLLADVPGLMTAIRSQPASDERLGEITEQTVTLLDSALGRAQQAGLLRPELTLDHLLVVLAMFDGVVSATSLQPGADLSPLALEVAVRGLRTPERAEEPLPTRQIPFPPPEPEQH